MSVRAMITMSILREIYTKLVDFFLSYTQDDIKSGIFMELLIDWFQTTLYTRVIVNVTKRMKRHPFCGANFSLNIRNFE